jgi:hypothetical protein
MIRSIPLALVVCAAACTGTEYPLCSTDDDCRGAERCFDGRCVQCMDDADCGPGQGCYGGVCQADLDGCTSNEDCADGKVCLFELCSECFEDDQCRGERICVDGRCTGCAGDEDCSGQMVCRQGECFAPAGTDGEAARQAGCPIEPVYFDWDSADLDAAAKEKLSAMAECMDPQKVYTLVGRADETGDAYYNLDLGLRRAEAVKDYLAARGFPEDHLVVSSAGEKLAGESDEKARRVDLLCDQAP